MASCGDRKCSTMVQRDGEDLLISAECPVGDHKLSIFARGPENAGKSYALAVEYCITVHQHAAISKDGFPILYNLFDDLGAVLDAPRSGHLKKGMQHFRVRLDSTA